MLIAPKPLIAIAVTVTDKVLYLQLGQCIAQRPRRSA